VRDLVVGSGIGFVNRGARKLKGVPGRWRLFAVHHLETSAAERIVPDKRARRLGDRALLGAVRRAPAVASAWSKLAPVDADRLSRPCAGLRSRARLGRRWGSD